MSTLPHLKIDFVSDVSCPWCAIGLWALEGALAQLDGELTASVHCQPFELNPAMPPGGQDITEHLTQKYGSTPEQQAQIRQTIRQRGAEAGFEFNAQGRGRIYNTFDAHRLLHWAGVVQPDRQLALKKALLVACHRDQQAMDDHAVLLAAVQQAGLDEVEAAQVLTRGEWTDDVREREALYTASGVSAVPAVIINDQYLVSGGQPQATYVQVLRQVLVART
jgi:predicted DsbA family dithiol-disulfide isomerase